MCFHIWPFYKVITGKRYESYALNVIDKTLFIDLVRPLGYENKE